MSEPAETNILIVDDQQANLTAMQSMLEPLGQRLLLARSGVDALKLLLDNDVAVILLDVNMPGLDGFETAQMIRDRERTRLVPIIFLTAHDPDSTKILRGYEMGAVDFVFKPVTVDAILRSKVSVFVELHKARLREHVLESEKRKVRELEAELESLRGLGVTVRLPVGDGIYGAQSLQKAFWPVFEELATAYGQVLDHALESQALKVDRGIADQLRQLAESLGFYRAGPRDVVELHSYVLAARTREVPALKARALVAEGRFLVLELMGHLVSFYRKYYSGSRSALSELSQKSQPSMGESKGGNNE